MLNGLFPEKEMQKTTKNKPKRDVNSNTNSQV